MITETPTLTKTCSRHDMAIKTAIFCGKKINWCPKCLAEKEDAQKKQEQEKRDQRKKFSEQEKRGWYVIEQIGKDAFELDFNNYIFPPAIHHQYLEGIKRLFDCNSRKNKVRIFFYGGEGTGKTLTASLILKNYAMEGYSIKFTTLKGFMRDYFSDGFKKKDKIINNCINSDVLVIDDIDHASFNQKISQEIKDIFDQREREKSGKLDIVIFTSNSPPNHRNINLLQGRRLEVFIPINFGNDPYPYKNYQGTKYGHNHPPQR